MSTPLLKVSKNVDKVTKNIKKSERQAKKWQNSVIKGMDKVIKKAAKVSLAVAAMIGAFAVKVGFEGLKDLDEVSAKVKSIAKNALKIKQIRKDLLKASTKTGIDVTELGETQYSAISSGVRPDESLQASITAGKLAKAGFTDSNSALKMLTSTMNVYGLKGQKAMQGISDKLLVTQNLGVTTVAELSESMGSLTPIANSAGTNIDELMAGMASLTKNGLKTDEAVTNFKGILTSVIKPTKEAAETAKELGIDFSVSAIKSKGFGKFLEEIKEKTGGNTETMGKLFGNVRALSGALILTGKGINDFNTSLDAMENSAGATEEAYKTMTNTIGFKFEKMKNTVKNVFTGIMDTQSGTIGKMVDDFDNWVQNNEKTIELWVNKVGDAITQAVNFAISVGKWVKRNKDMIASIGTFLIALWGVIKIFGIVKKAVMAAQTVWLLLNGTIALTPIGWVIVGITALITAGILLWKNWDKIKSKLLELMPCLKDVGKFIKEHAIVLFEKMKQTVSTLKTTAIQPIIDIFNTKFAPALKTVGKLVGFLLQYIFIPFGIFIGQVFIARIKNAILFAIDIFKILFQSVSSVIQGIMLVFSGIIEFISGVFTGNWEKAWTGIKDIFGGIFQGLVGLVKAPINAIISMVNRVIRNVNDISNIKAPDWLPGIGGKKLGFSIPEIPTFARGGIAKRPSIFGEAGAEMAIPLKPNNPRSLSLLDQAERIIGRRQYNQNNTTIHNINTHNRLFGNNQRKEKEQVFHFHFHGDIYGMDDFKEKVMEVIVKIFKQNKPNTV